MDNGRVNFGLMKLHSKPAFFTPILYRMSKCTRDCWRSRNWFAVLFALSFAFTLFPVLAQGVDDRQKKEFIATEEWQEVPSGQSIPPGLHIRLDLNTNRREAKLISPQDKLEYEQYAVVQPSHGTGEKSPTGNQNSEFIPDSLSIEERYAVNAKSRFRSYEELKTDFETINTQIKTDHELVSEILVELRKQDIDESRILVLLEDLDYLLHQVDNGKKFAEDGGLSFLSTLLQNPQPEIQQAVLSAISAIVQGNTLAKMVALQNGTLDRIHSLLDEAAEQDVTNIDTLKLIQRGVGTLGALLRDFPVAQRYFFGNQTGLSHLSPPGFILLSRLFNLTQTPHQTELSVDIRVRILTLLSDIARERSSAKERSHNPNDTVGQRLWALYSSYPFESDLVNTGWCPRLRHSLLTDMHLSTDTTIAQVNHDRREKLLESLLHLHPMCERVLFDQNTTDERNVMLNLMRMEEEYTNMMSNPVFSSSFSDKPQTANSDFSVIPEDEGGEELEVPAKDLHHLITVLLELRRNASQYDTTRDAAEL